MTMTIEMKPELQFSSIFPHTPHIPIALFNRSIRGRSKSVEEGIPEGGGGGAVEGDGGRRDKRQVSGKLGYFLPNPTHASTCHWVKGVTPHRNK